MSVVRHYAAIIHVDELVPLMVFDATDVNVVGCQFGLNPTMPGGHEELQNERSATVALHEGLTTGEWSSRGAFILRVATHSFPGAKPCAC